MSLKSTYEAGDEGIIALWVMGVVVAAILVTAIVVSASKEADPVALDECQMLRSGVYLISEDCIEK